MPGIEMLSKRNPSICSERLCIPSLVLNVLKPGPREVVQTLITYVAIIKLLHVAKWIEDCPKKADTWNGDSSDFQEVVFVPHKSYGKNSLKANSQVAPLKSNGWKMFYIFLFPWAYTIFKAKFTCWTPGEGLKLDPENQDREPALPHFRVSVSALCIGW